MKKQNQKGALLVEVIAVLGLIALITPILFNQIQRRNEEIVDAQIASEVRAVKDALSAYIQANEDALAVSCGLASIDSDTNQLVYDTARIGDEEPCGAPNWQWNDDERDVVNNYSTTDISSILGDYNVVLYARNIVSKWDINEEDPVAVRPSIYAIAYKIEPEPNLRRAAKIAAMVGVEGGVAQTANGKISGMQDVWSSKDNITGISQYAVAVTTSFDATTNSAILKDATFSHVNAQSVQGDNVAGGNLGTRGILSVGDASCIVGYGNDTVTIRGKGTYEDGTCAPVFEVNPTTKEVTIAGVIRTGAPTGADCTTGHTKSACEDLANCAWIPDLNTEDTNDGTCVAEYVLDPANISVVNDIKLSSRGGAKLSDILPKWSLMKVEELIVTGNTFPVSTKLNGENIIACPPGYKQGLIVFPSRIYRTGVTTANPTNTSTTGKLDITMGYNIGESSDNIQVTVKNLRAPSNDTYKEKVIVQRYCVYDP